jgi:hypothetical protein
MLKSINKINIIFINLQMAKIYKILISIFIKMFNIDEIEIKHLSILFKTIGKMWRECGLSHTIKYLKLARLHATRFMTGEPLIFKEHQTISVSIDKDGFPKIFRPWKGAITSKARWGVVKVLTILTISRAFRRFKTDKLPIDLDPIVKPSKYDDGVINWALIDEVILSMRLRKLRIEDLRKTDWKLFSSAGPDGLSAKTALLTLYKMSWSVVFSLGQLVGKKTRDYLNNLRTWAVSPEFLQLTNPNIKWYNIGRDDWEDNPRERTSPWIRKLGLVEDPELKARVIAIFDYYSQNILNSISKQVFELLKSIPSDRTFSQDPYFNHYGFRENEDHYWSIDLSSATDRFPLALQVQLLKRLGLKEIEAKSWSDVMVGSPFMIPSSWKLPLKEVYYRAGQPMGARSSWPVFTLCHHIIVKYCARLCGYKQFDNYIILGDDIVIKDDKVSKKYFEVMNLIDVQTSENKTHKSLTTYEFAKRWIRNGEEISPIPISGIIDNISNLGVIYQIFYEICVTRNLVGFQLGNFSKGFNSWYSSLSQTNWNSGTLEKLLKKCNKRDKGGVLKLLKQSIVRFKPTSINSLKRRTQDFNFFLRYSQDKLTYEELRCFICNVINSKNEDAKDFWVPVKVAGIKTIINTAIQESVKILIYNNTKNQFGQFIKELKTKDKDNLLKWKSYHPYMLPYLGSQDKWQAIMSSTLMGRAEPSQVFDQIMSFENDLFQNREGSSKTKRFVNFNRFVRLTIKSIKNLNTQSDFRPPVRQHLMNPEWV